MKFILLDSLFGPFKTKILSLINNLDPEIRRRRVSNEFCLEQILRVLKKGIGWRDATIESISYSTVYQRFSNWVKKGIFTAIWNCLLDLYVHRKLAIDRRWFKVLFIDSSMIKNVRGTDCKGRNHFDRNRFATKISIICDKRGIPVSNSFYRANCHDVTTIDSSLDALKNNMLPDKRMFYSLIGDRGYIVGTERKQHIRDVYKTNMITPYRKNQKKRLTSKERDLLKDRILIEHLFNKLDNFKRLKLREERWLVNYEALNYLALSIITLSGM